MATHIAIIVLQSLLSPEGLYNETLTSLQWIKLLHTRYFNDNLDFNAIMDWMDSLTIWSHKGNKSLCIMYELRVSHSASLASNNGWTDGSLCREGRLRTLGFSLSVHSILL